MGVTIDKILGDALMHDHVSADITDLTTTLDPLYVNVTGDTMTGNLNMGTYNLIGGTGITDILKLQSTTGNGTLTSPAIQLLTGNNGATTAVTVLNNGDVGIGTTAPAGKLHINGTADDEQLIIRGNSTQTANLTEWQNSSGTVLAYISKDGQITTQPNYTIGDNNTYPAFQSTPYYQPTANNTATMIGLYSQANLSDSAYTAGYLIGAKYDVNSYSNQSVINVGGFLADVAHRGSGAVTRAYGARARVNNAGSATIGEAQALFAMSALNSGGGTITNNYGLYIENQTVGTNNYAIFTGTGLNEFNDQLFIDGSADRIQLRVQAHSSQTTNLQTWENSSGTGLAAISGTGHLGIGTSSPGNAYLYVNATTMPDSVSATITNRLAATDPTSNQYLMGSRVTAKSTAGALGYSLTANFNEIWLDATNTQNWTATYGMIALRNKIEFRGGATGTVTGAVAFYNEAEIGAATLTNYYGGLFTNPIGAGTLTNNYALYIENQTKGATSNYAIFTNAGLNEFNDQLFLDGSADRIQLRVQAHSTQTTNLATFENSSGTVVAGVTGTGSAGFGTAPSATYTLNISRTTSDTGVYGANIEARINTTTNYGSRSSALDMQCQYFGSNNLTASYSGSGYSWGGLMGFYGGTLHSGTGTVDTIIATSGQNLLRSGAVATNVFGLYSNPVFVDVGTATITNAFGLYVKNPFNTSGTITNFYGIYLPSLDKATNNYAILTNAGNIVFNEGGDASTDFRVESDTEANMLYLDANGDTDGALYLGGTTNGIKVNKGGVLTFLGTANISGGATGTFTTADAKTVTVTGGIITAIV